ncbi:hypothetical protein HYV10_01590 [Candidatus Dependentiae bacterium]|nr:hypothetical protein [Candidatus Dependentiae bacterium]
MKNASLLAILFILNINLCLCQKLNSSELLNKNYKDLYIWQDKNELTASEDSVLTVLGRWAWGPCNAVDTKDNFVFMGNGQTFHVLEISEAGSLKIISEYLTDGYVYDIELQSKLAFVCIGKGLLILDVTNPSAPKKISEINISGIAISLAPENNFVYITTFSGMLWVVDITNPQIPFLRGSISAGGMIASCVEVKDQIVFVGNPEYPSLVLIDATNPDTLTRTFIDINGWGLAAYIKDTLLFLGVKDANGKRYLKIFDVADPKNLSFLSQVEINASLINGLTFSEENRTVYILSHDKGIYSINISDIKYPKVLDKYKRELPVAVGNVGISLLKNFLLSAYFNGLCVLDISKSDSLKETTFFPTGGYAQKVTIKDDVVFLASGLSGLWILDVSEPTKPKQVSNICTGSFTEEVIVEDTLAYFINWAVYSDKDTLQGLWIADVSDIYKPKILSHYTGSVRFSYTNAPNSIAKSGNLIFITQVPSNGNDTILEIVDVSNPLIPKRVSAYQNDYTPYDIAVKDSVAFVATSDRGLRIIDWSVPHSPREISIFHNSTNYSVFGVTVLDSFAYADRIDTFFVLNVSNSRQPFEIGKFGRNYGSFSSIVLAATNKFVYWVEGELGVIDVSDPQNPKEITKFWGSDWGTGVVAKDIYIFFSDRAKGLWILRNNIITSVDNKPSEILPSRY